MLLVKKLMEISVCKFCKMPIRKGQKFCSLEHYYAWMRTIEGRMFCTEIVKKREFSRFQS